jgi:hypothetical protein
MPKPKVVPLLPTYLRVGLRQMGPRKMGLLTSSRLHPSVGPACE